MPKLLDPNDRRSKEAVSAWTDLIEALQEHKTNPPPAVWIIICLFLAAVGVWFMPISELPELVMVAVKTVFCFVLAVIAITLLVEWKKSKTKLIVAYARASMISRFLYVGPSRYGLELIEGQWILDDSIQYPLDASKTMDAMFRVFTKYFDHWTTSAVRQRVVGLPTLDIKLNLRYKEDVPLEERIEWYFGPQQDEHWGKIVDTAVDRVDKTGLNWDVDGAHVLELRIKEIIDQMLDEIRAPIESSPSVVRIRE